MQRRFALDALAVIDQIGQINKGAVAAADLNQAGPWFATLRVDELQFE